MNEYPSVCCVVVGLLYKKGMMTAASKLNTTPRFIFIGD